MDIDHFYLYIIENKIIVVYRTYSNIYDDTFWCILHKYIQWVHKTIFFRKCNIHNLLFNVMFFNNILIFRQTLCLFFNIQTFSFLFFVLIMLKI